MKRLFGFIYFFALATLIFTPGAKAYIDPATTSYLIQIIAGVFIAAGTVVGVFWKKIRLFFRNKKMARLEKKLTAEAEKREQSRITK